MTAKRNTFGRTMGRAIVWLALLLPGACMSRQAPRGDADVGDGAGVSVITNAMIVEGSGAPGRRGSVRVVGDRIDQVGTVAARPGDTVVDGTGMVLAPGFIDTHSHADRGLGDHPDALAVVSQGITTVVAGQDGGSELPLSAFFAELDRHPAAVNIASYAGHGTIRSRVMGEDYRRPATAAEIERMRELLREEMRTGALGMFTGLEYDPGIYSEPAEVVELAKVAPRCARRRALGRSR